MKRFLHITAWLTPAGVLAASLILGMHQHTVSAQRPPSSSFVRRTLTQTTLIAGVSVNSLDAELTSFLWEPFRYDPPPSEAYLEVDNTYVDGTFRLELFDATRGVPIPGSAVVLSQAGRFRSENFATSLPSSNTELRILVYVVQNGQGIDMTRTAVLLQQ